MELLRVIREEEPPRPSTRISGSGQALATISQQRGTEPAKPARLVRGELDWIVMKCLEKDRNRRYDTAIGLARDLERYLRDEAIEACPPSVSYRLRKLLRRHRRLAATLAGAAVLLLAAGLFAYRDHRLAERQLADQRRHEEDLLAHWRHNALDQALLAARGGDLGGAEEAIGEAERLGTSTGQLRLLRGQVALHRGENEQAIRHLEQAVQLLPESVAARALLGIACLYDGQWARHERILAELEQLTPATPEDYLFKGRVESVLDPVQGLRTLDEAIRRRDSPIARVVRAEARIDRALDTGDSADAQRALTDVAVAKELIPNDPVVGSVSLLAYLAAATAAEQAGESARRQEFVAWAGAEASALTEEQSAALPYALFARCQYYEYVGEDASVFEALRRARARAGGGFGCYGYALALYRRGEFAQALEVLDQSRESPAELCRPYVLAELSDGPGRAREACRAIVGRHPDGLVPIVNLAALRLFGRGPEFAAAARELREHPDRLPRQWREFHQRLLDYHCDLLTADEFLQSAGPSKWNQCQAHYFVGIGRLAAGDRPAARDHFRRCVATRVATLFAYEWSRAFLARMDKDPDWPSWIERKR